MHLDTIVSHLGRLARILTQPRERPKGDFSDRLRKKAREAGASVKTPALPSLLVR
jgi:hypothetical protein